MYVWFPLTRSYLQNINHSNYLEQLTIIRVKKSNLHNDRMKNLTQCLPYKSENVRLEFLGLASQIIFWSNLSFFKCFEILAVLYETFVKKLLLTSKSQHENTFIVLDLIMVIEDCVWCGLNICAFYLPLASTFFL